MAWRWAGTGSSWSAVTAELAERSPMAAITSRRSTRPSAPVPSMWPRSMPFSLAKARAAGVAGRRPSAPVGPAGTAGADGIAGPGSAAAAVAIGAEEGRSTSGTSSPGWPSQPSTVPAATTSAGCLSTRKRVPLSTASTSRLVLSDSTSNRGSPSATSSPSALNQHTRRSSSLAWPKAGMRSG